MRLLHLFEQPDQGLWFHMSPKQFDPSGLRSMSHLGTKQAALERGLSQMRISNTYDMYLYVYEAHPRSSARMRDIEDQHDAVRTARALRRSETFIDSLQYQAVVSGRTEAIRTERLQQALSHNGFDSIMYRNEIEDVGSMSMVVVDTSILKPVRIEKYENGVYKGVVGELVERRIQNTELMYHGTSDKFLRSIIKQGLLANPPQRTFSGSSDDPEPGYQTFGGVYITNNIHKAKAASSDAVDRFGGKPMIVVVQYVQGSGNLDEDIFTNTISRDIHYAADYYYNEQAYDTDDPEEFSKLDSFTDYALAHRTDVLDGLVDSASYHFMRFGKLGNPFLPTLRKAFNYVLDNVGEGDINSGDMMTVLRDHPAFIRMIEVLMANVFPTEDREANDLAFQITRNIGFRGKTKIVRMEYLHGPPIWENPNAQVPE